MGEKLGAGRAYMYSTAGSMSMSSKLRGQGKGAVGCVRAGHPLEISTRFLNTQGDDSGACLAVIMLPLTKGV